MANQQYRWQFGDTTFTKVFVGGLAWETERETMRRYFDQFGEILEAVIIMDKNTGRSKGYGFVTFRDPESARRACLNPNPVIDGRRANCNIASLGRPRPGPLRGQTQFDAPYYGGATRSVASYTRLPPPSAAPPPPPPFATRTYQEGVLYSPYGYAPDYGNQQSIYSPYLQSQYYYHQIFGTSSPTTNPPYPTYALVSYPRANISGTHGLRVQAPPYYSQTAMHGERSMAVPSQRTPASDPISTTDSHSSQEALPNIGTTRESRED